MKTLYFLFLFIFFFITSTISAQAPYPKDRTIQINTTIQPTTPSITFSWDARRGVGNYQIYRKATTSNSWTRLDSLSGSATSWTDNTITKGQLYEYKIQGYLYNWGNTYNTYAFSYAGIEYPAVHYRGKIILLVDNSKSSALAAELSQLEDDFTLDGWKVIRHDVAPTETVTNVKNLIITAYNSDKNNTKAIFIVGHVPVPYSGNTAFDGHTTTPNHTGAWAADAYYGEMNENWTDKNVNNTAPTRAENKNIPGDGKFDNSFFASMELQVGRVDMSNLPAFTTSETELLRKYLVKNHNYKNKLITTVQRVLIDDNWGYGDYSSGAWRLSSVVGKDNMIANDYLTTLETDAYQWAYGGGAGAYTACNGVGTTADFTTKNPKAIFTMMFGSFFGDWDSQNNILRAPLAAGTVLTNVWSGRPRWQFHPMGMGFNIGYAHLLTQNSTSNYDTLNNNFPTGIQTALMGDPTLRMHIIAPPTNLVATSGSNSVSLNWNTSSEAVLGYYIYRKNATTGLYDKLNTNVITGTNYTDAQSSNASARNYIVRAVNLENSSGGSYYNLSQGIFNTTGAVLATNNSVKNNAIVVSPNPSNGKFIVELNTNGNLVKISIFDVNGRIVVQKNIRTTKGLNKYEINETQLSSGNYILKIDDSEKVYTSKIIIK